MTSVFISSTMRGMEELRDAVVAACAGLSIDVERAEDFLATGTSPSGACLQGVTESDGVVLLIGPRYGDRQASGKSATEEEVDRARELGKEVLAFRTSEDLEPEQEAFFDRIAGWQSGHFIQTSLSPRDLQRDVTKALTSWSSAPPSTDQDQVVARNLARVVPEVQSGWTPQWGPWLAVSWANGRKLVIPDDLLFDGLPEVLGDLLVAGSHRLLDQRPKVKAVQDGLEIASAQNSGEYLTGWVGADGGVALGFSIDDGGRSGLGDLNEMMFLRPAVVLDTMGRALGFVGAVLDRLDADHVVTAGRFQVSLSHLGMKHLADPFTTGGGGVPMRGMSGDQDAPVRVPPAPEPLVRSQLAPGSPFIEAAVKRLERAFRGT